MNIRFYGYNAFVIQTSHAKILIDPGATFFYFFQFRSLMPKSEWRDASHILVTHGDPDHYWYADKVAAASKAPVILNETMLREQNGRKLALGPRDKGLSFTTEFDPCYPLSVGGSVEVDGVNIRGFVTRHGPLQIRLGPIKKSFHPGPGERIGWGAIGFEIELEQKRIVNMGDTLLLSDDWQGIRNPDVLMIPIGGREARNTMDENDALRAVELIQPRLVIPCHYNCQAFFTQRFAPADADRFKTEVERMGLRCELMQAGDSITL